MNLLCPLFIVLFFISGPLMANNEVQTYGYVEKATLPDNNLILSAKLDTGAKSASLNATDITPIDVNGVPYLRYTVPTKTGNFTFESKYIGKVKIKVRANETAAGTPSVAPIKRPVVLLKIRLGDKERLLPVNLTNRKRFLYPLLLGRDAIISFSGSVDPALTFTTKSKSLNK